MVERVEMLAARTAMLVANATRACRWTIDLIIGRLVHSQRGVFALRVQPVQPSFDIPRWQQKAATFMSCKGRKVSRLKLIRHLPLAGRWAVAIFVEETKDPSAFSKAGEVGHLERELGFHPVVA